MTQKWIIQKYSVIEEMDWLRNLESAILLLHQMAYMLAKPVPTRWRNWLLLNGNIQIKKNRDYESCGFFYQNIRWFYTQKHWYYSKAANEQIPMSLLK